MQVPPNTAPNIYASVASGDFNGDGRDDLVASLQGRHDLEVFLQTPTGTLAAPLAWTLSPFNYMPSNMLFIEDFNNDGASDIVFDTRDENGRFSMDILVSQPGKQPVLLRRELTSMSSYGQSGGGSVAYVALDLNGDGNVDMVEFESWRSSEASPATCNTDGTCPRIVLYAGDGTGAIGVPQILPWKGPPQPDARDFFVQDIDMDGREDVVFKSMFGYPEQDKLYGMKRNPDGSLADPMLLVDMNGVDAPSFFGDLNGDGRTDLIYGDIVRFREPGGALGVPVRLGLRYNMESYWNVLGDFDGNGATDLVNHQFESFTKNLPYFVTYLQKDGQLQSPFFRYDPPTTNLVSPAKWSRQAAAVGDFNGDGCRDIVVAAQYSGLLFLEGRNCIRAAH